MTTGQRRVVVVGGGVAGLTAAYYLKKRGADVEVLEREQSVGGMVRSSLKDEKYIVELGAQAFAASNDAVFSLARELSMHNLIVGENDVPADRFVYSKGKIHKVPVGTLSILRSGLVPLSAKISMLARRTRSDDSEQEDAPISLLDPFTTHAWAGDSKDIEYAGQGIGPASALPGLLSFKWGMGTLTARLEELLRGSIHAGVCAKGIERGAGGYRVMLDSGRKALNAAAVVMAAPAHAASSVLAPLDQTISELLSSIPYVPLAVVHASFKDADIKPDLRGAGFVVANGAGARMLSVVYPSTLFPGRCPHGEKLIACFMGGAMDEAAVELPDAELIDIARAGLKDALGIDAAPRFSFIKRWVHAAPQLTRGHKARVEDLQKSLGSHPGLFVTGGYFTGSTVADAITHARDIANRATAYLRTI